MTFLQFLATLTSAQSPQTYSVICFKATKEIPLIFFQEALSALKKNDVYTEIIDAHEHDVSKIIARFETSFLGTQVFYWVRGVATLEAKKKKELLAYLSSYQGPNVVSCVITEDDMFKPTHKQIATVEVPTFVDRQLYTQLATLLVPHNSATAAAMGNALFKQKQPISLDGACLLIRYGMLLGSSVDRFLAEWLPHIMSPEQSLFMLSQLFFAKESKKFLLYWSSIKKEYPAVFWTVYFSEQLWRAVHFVQAAEKKGDVKSLSFRLPFSFIKGDWQKTSAQELVHAHQALYDIDWAVKNGLGEHQLDLFCVKFLSGGFNPKILHFGIK